ncbi:hypothetical protein [Oricola cellulosilytica]|uniref:hypothetical protein n=1 Tax=Oricola cellulosilytica TaxID=1429082 RepID=UPI001304E6F5|nr:hypothetical protein [Oricola cellulosilytica]
MPASRLGTTAPFPRCLADGSGLDPRHEMKEPAMRAIGLWLLGVPLWLVIMLAFFTDWV